MTDRAAEFAAFLESKRVIDEESINARVRAAFEEQIATCSPASVLDIGTGTGAAIRRLLRSGAVGSGTIVGLDADAFLLSQAQERVRDELVTLGYAARARDGLIEASRGADRIDVTLTEADVVAGTGALPYERFDAVTAHSFMDIVPLDLAVRFVRSMLRPGGLLYATMNYDGVTELVPSYGDGAFERHLLAVYDRSMDDRRVNGLATGGSRSAQRLYDNVVAHGFSVIGYGSSDWSLFPWGGSYRAEHEQYLVAMVETIAREGRRHPELEDGSIDRWRAGRLEDVSAAKLALVVHQCDLLARLD